MEKNQRNSRKRLNSLILLVAFTAIMLIVSTYAWFSTQKDVIINGLEGDVSVAKGLLVSLDAENWKGMIDLANPEKSLNEGFTFANPYNGSNNIIPKELIPVSATGVDDIVVSGVAGSGKKEMTFYSGTSEGELFGIDEVDLTNSTSAGLFAFDLFLQNSSKMGESDVQGTTKETLQLNTNSLLQLVENGLTSSGLQNTVRVAIANYGYDDKTGGSVDVKAKQDEILAAFANQKITDIAIWEPNASDHVSHIVKNNNSIKWEAGIKTLYGITDANGLFTATSMLPTYALTAGSKTKTITDVYDWNITDTNTDGIDDNTGLQRQIALQTKKSAADYTIEDGGVRNLVSVKSTGARVYEFGNETGAVPFQIYKNQVSKVRVYVWLEGQDVDTINNASHGTGIHLNLGLIKEAPIGE